MFTMQVRMAKSAKAVEEFLANLATKLKPLVDKELKELLRYKSEEVCSSILKGWGCHFKFIPTSASNVA